MKILKHYAVLTILTLLIGQRTWADLKVTNLSGKTVIFAYGYIENAHHIAKGWILLKEGETKILIAGSSLKQTYYYYATSPGFIWKDSEIFYIDTKHDFTLTGLPAPGGTIVAMGFKKEYLGPNPLTDYTIRLEISPAISPKYSVKPLLKAPNGTHQSKEVN